MRKRRPVERVSWAHTQQWHVWRGRSGRKAVGRHRVDGAGEGTREHRDQEMRSKTGVCLGQALCTTARLKILF